MSGAGFSLTWRDEGLGQALEALARRLGDLRPVMQEIGETLVASTMLAFREERDPWGRSWDRLSTVTIARRRQGPRPTASVSILRDKGTLANSFSAQATADSVEVGTALVYAATHQFGAKQGQYGRYSQVSRWRQFAEGDFRKYAGTKKGFPIPWGDIPARPFLPIRPDGRVELPASDEGEILALLTRKLGEALA